MRTPTPHEYWLITVRFRWKPCDPPSLFLSIERSSGPPSRAINNDWFLWKDFWYNDFLDVDGFIYLFICLIFLRQAQYVFIHDALVEYVTCGSTEFAVRDLPENLRVLNTIDPDSGDSLLVVEFKVLNFFKPVDFVEFWEGLPTDLGMQRFWCFTVQETTQLLLIIMFDSAVICSENFDSCDT